MPYRRPWYMQVRWHLVLFPLLFATALGLVFFFAVRLANAGGPAVVTWNQPTDCPSITGWELAAAAITTAKPNPTFADATVQVSIANTAPLVCGLGASKTVNLNGVGSARYWLTSVAGTIKAGPSNSVDASLPLGKADGLTVVPQ